MPFENVMTPRQARAARAVLGMSVRELSGQCGISASSIRRIEAGDTTLDTLARLQAYLQDRDIAFVRQGERHCVCWTEPPPNESLAVSLARGFRRP